MNQCIVPSSCIFLIVDQLDNGRDLLKKTLSHLGYHYTVEAKSASEALTKIEMNSNNASPINLILCDWRIANEGGLELVKKIRSLPSSSEVPIIMISSDSDLSHMLVASSMNINAYLVRPYVHESLKSSLEAAWLWKTG